MTDLLARTAPGTSLRRTWIDARERVGVGHADVHSTRRTLLRR